VRDTSGVRALLVDERGELRLAEDLPAPQPAAGEALVHVRLAGICDTDLQLLAGYAGFRGVLGHEFVGLVDAGDPELGGRRVVADINIGCGECRECLEANGHHCARRTTIGIRDRPGVFAEQVAIPRRKLVPVPEHVEDELAVFAEPLAAALHVLDEVEAGDERIDVLGDGKLGLLIALALSGAGRRVRIIGHHRTKLERLAQAGPAGPTIDAGLEQDLDDGDASRSAVVVEATGHPAGLARALWLARPRGRVILKTTTAAPIPIDLAKVVVDELQLVGSRCGDMRRAVELLASGEVDPRPLIDARYLLSQGSEAFEHAARRGALKVLLEPR
jgi:threonine dehydrogenase-like Zn-dependent dehydrogenase